MGSSGGGLPPSRPVSELLDELQRGQEEARDNEFDTEVATFLNDLLARLNAREAEAIRRHLDTLTQAISGAIECVVDMIFGGSVGKHTYVDGLSDVDALVCLKDQDLAALTPAEVLSRFADAVRQRLPNTPVRVGTLAVTVEFSDGHEIQLLPAIPVGTGYRIAASDGRQWSAIQPRVFADALTKANAARSGMLIPTIKLAKAINNSLPASQQLTGYHIESLALAAFPSYGGHNTPKAMLCHFFTRASELVAGPIADPTGQSPHVDDYLGPPGGAQRKAASAALARIAHKMRTADIGRSPVQWEALFGGMA